MGQILSFLKIRNETTQLWSAKTKFTANDCDSDGHPNIHKRPISDFYCDEK